MVKVAAEMVGTDRLCVMTGRPEKSETMFHMGAPYPFLVDLQKSMMELIHQG